MKPRKPIRSAFMVFCLCMAFALPAMVHAQTPPPPPPSEVQDEEIVRIVEENWTIVDHDYSAENEVGPNEFVLYEIEPEPLNMDSVLGISEYPDEAIEKGIEGKVLVRVQFDEKGDYLKHIVIHDPHPLLTREVNFLLPKLRFRPAIVKGEPIKAWLTLPFSFKLRGDDDPPKED